MIFTKLKWQSTKVIVIFGFFYIPHYLAKVLYVTPNYISISDFIAK